MHPVPLGQFPNGQCLDPPVSSDPNRRVAARVDL
jgi:hypothetical protein